MSATLTCGVTSRLSHWHARERTLIHESQRGVARRAEHHTMRSSIDGEATRGGLRTRRHVDQGSLLTIDVLLTDVAS